MHTAYINSKMDDKFGSLEQTLGQLTADVSRLKQYVGRDREDIQQLQEDNDNVMQQLEQELNSVDMVSRRCNLKISWSKRIDEGQLQSERRRGRGCIE